MRELEAAAKASATSKVVNTFNRPGQLDKIDQIKQRYSRKKASVEALLKSAMQQQLDGVRIGLNQLHCSLEDVLEIENRSSKEMEGYDVPHLEKSVSSKIEGTQVEEREDNKHWLIRYLELIRMMILEDLRVVKTLCVPCFPPKYNIIDRYIHMYHNCLSIHLQEIIQNGLEGNEYVTILSWIMKTYMSNDLLGHPDLTEHTAKLPSLLPEAVLDRLEGEYLKNIEQNYTEWMQNTLKSEKEEWRSNMEPHLDSYSRTAAPIIIFQMIDQNLQVAKTISDKLTIKSLNLSIEQVVKFGDSFRDAIIEFKNKYLKTENRGTFFRLNEAVNYLLEELFIDLDQHFEKLFTSQWLGTNLPADTIYATIEDYFQDYNHLVESNYKYVVDLTRSMVAKRYLTAMLSKRTSFKTYEECTKAANKVLKETERLSQLFANLSKDLEGDDPFEAIILLSEVLKSNDDMLSFELHRIVEKYPDISEDHLLRLLSLRGDL
ncbi:hypothetical protein NQ318_002448 [Aromia moschata]|uniref:Exocyst complex component Sec6 n=1 Tax=Aromia moschata TaxID=1265417 RepID=A0AAV8Y821_9CUCU|nr:hypothetical protein NQ318_002448 [Aromia moschata]